jgi:serine protease Do
VNRLFAVAIAILLCLGHGLFAQESPSGMDVAAAMEKALVEVIGRTEKSVVAITRVRRERSGEAVSIEARPDAFGRRTLPVATPQPTDPDFIPNEFATGVVVDARGLILTASHVLGDDSDYYVTAADRKVYRASVKAADPRSDLAVLALEKASNLIPISFGDAAELKKGQIVITLGNPYAIAHDGQVCSGWGIVSNLGRKAPASPSESDPSGHPTLHHYGTLIQTDAKLNLGVSGGPLVNLKGEMVGLMVALPAAVGYEMAGGYAYPVDTTFRRAVETLKQGREVEYGFLGVLPSNVQTADSPSASQGVRVSQVLSGTPAARSGLRVNDVVTAVDDHPVVDVDGFYLEVGRQSAEAVTRLNVVRDGRDQIVEVALSKYPVRGRKIVTLSDPDWRGLKVDYPTAVVDADGRPRGGASFADDAVAVAEVLEGSPAWRAGLRLGVLIDRVDNVPIRTPKEFAAAVADKTGLVPLRVVGDEANPLRIVAPGS